jgi:hypothetical protein
MNYLFDKFLRHFRAGKNRMNIEKVAGLVGEGLLPLLPKRTRRISKKEFTLINKGRRNIIDRLLRAGLARRILREGNLNQLATYHCQFWSGEMGKEYHDSHGYAFESVFKPNFHYIVDMLNNFLKSNPVFKTLCEIGTGSGQLLDFLGDRLNTIDRFIGIDLNQDTVADNKKRYKNNKLEFIAADGDSWTRINGQPNWVFFSHRGVLEYFPEENLQGLFTFIANEISPAIFVAIEPVGVDHDLGSERESKIYGREFAFSHNYPHLFQKAGFELWHFELINFTDHRLCAIVAVAGGFLINGKECFATNN